MDERELTIRTAIRDAQALLTRSPSTTPRLDAELLLGHVLDLDRTRLLSRQEEVLTGSQRAAFEALTIERLRGTPIAYLTGRREFMNLTLDVGPGALVPRPETELLVTWAIEHITALGDATGHLVVDVGTGTGAVALALGDAFRYGGPVIAGCDISVDALRWACRNRERLDLGRNVHFVQGDMVSWLGRPASLVLANLPYLREDQIRGNWELSAEPELALVGGDDGLDHVRRLLADAPRVLGPDGAIALEIDHSQREAVVGLIARYLPWLNPRVHKDLAGFDRFVTATAAR